MTKQKSFWDMTKEESEALLREATKVAIKDLHDHGICSVHGDEKGIYNLYSDGRKVYLTSSPT